VSRAARAEVGGSLTQQRVRPKRKEDSPQRTQRSQRSIRRADYFNQRQLHAKVTTMIARIDPSIFISAPSALSAVVPPCARRRQRAHPCSGCILDSSERHLCPCATTEHSSRPPAPRWADASMNLRSGKGRPTRHQARPTAEPHTRPRQSTQTADRPAATTAPRIPRLKVVTSSRLAPMQHGAGAE